MWSNSSNLRKDSLKTVFCDCDRCRYENLSRYCLNIGIRVYCILPLATLCNIVMWKHVELNKDNFFKCTSLVSLTKWYTTYLTKLNIAQSVRYYFLLSIKNTIHKINFSALVDKQSWQQHFIQRTFLVAIATALFCLIIH